ncbi:PQQ-binding-like beta-propeller repeat protein [Peribacillus acanthi]|uniref:outer membrane protein assembly factor BamB family protein n=1 Tax=Peribacillus acanthi TaxID=2171554 RepID=UPI000D3E2E04|nr:PQQ-binding-like beta-propeller repeat protein [Peribacillus acanthi]
MTKKILFIIFFVCGVCIFFNQTADAVTVKSLEGYKYNWKYSTGSYTKNNGAFNIVEVDSKSGNIVYTENSSWGTILELGLMNSKGKKVWKKTQVNFEIVSVKGNYIIVQSYDKEDYLVVSIINKLNGSSIRHISYKSSKILHATEPNVVVDNQLNIFVTSKSRLIAMNSQGKKLWELDKTLPVNLDLTFSSPVVKDDYLVTSFNCSGSELCSMLDRDELMILSKKDGKQVVWKNRVKTWEFFLSGDGKRIIVSEGDGVVSAYSFSDGTKLWSKTFKVGSSEYLSFFLKDDHSLEEDSLGNFFVTIGNTDILPGQLVYKAIYSIGPDGRNRWGANISSLKETGRLTVSGYLSSGKVINMMGEKGYYKLDNAKGRLIQKTPFVRKAAVKYADYTKAPIIKRTGNSIIGSDDWATSLDEEFTKNIWSSRHQIYNKTGKLVGAITHTNPMDPAQIYVLDNFQVYIVNNFGVYSYSRK